MKQELLKLAAQDLKTEASDLTLEDGSVASKKDPWGKKKITEVSALKDRGVILGIGYRRVQIHRTRSSIPLALNSVKSKWNQDRRG